MKRREILLGTSAIAATTVAGVAQGMPAQKAPKPEMAHPAAPHKEPMPHGKMVPIADKLMGYYVAPAAASSTKPVPAVIVIMEAFGLNSQIKSVCDMCAQYGYAALAPDIYHGSVYDYKDLNGAIAKLKTLKDEQFIKEFGQSLDFLAKHSEVNAKAIGTVGFCMGGRFSFLANTAYPDRVKVSVSFYGAGIAADPDPLGRASLLDRVSQLKSPVLLIYSAEDDYINSAEHARIVKALSDHRIHYALSVFPHTHHGFANDQRETYAPAAAHEAWDMTFGFFKRYLKQAGVSQ